MALLEALYATDLIDLLMFDTPIISSFSSSSGAATPPFTASKNSSDATLVLKNSPIPQQQEEEESKAETLLIEAPKVITRRRTRDSKVVPTTRAPRVVGARNVLGPQSGSRKKRKRRPRACTNKDEAENQRMTHIAVERNRRRQMNEHLAVLRSLMPESFVRRGDQASIVGGAVEFVKVLEHLLHNLETNKHQFLQRGEEDDDQEQEQQDDEIPTKFSQISKFLFLYPQITRSRSGSPNGKTEAIADIEVTLIETHANMRILSRRNPRQLSRLVSGFHALHLTILHLCVTTLEPMVLYSISAKVEEGCQLTSVHDIAGAVHHLLRIIDEVK